jgi:hypothetical protein
MVCHQPLERLDGVIAALIGVVQQAIELAATPDRHDQGVGDPLAIIEPLCCRRCGGGARYFGFGRGCLPSLQTSDLDHKHETRATHPPTRQRRGLARVVRGQVRRDDHAVHVRAKAVLGTEITKVGLG